MDDIVKAAIAKWPNVPAVFGWLSLNGRGNWRCWLRGHHRARQRSVRYHGGSDRHQEHGRPLR